MTVRECLQTKAATSTTHMALWIDRFLPDFGKAGAPAAHLEGALGTIRVPAGYTDFVDRWKATLPPSAVTARAMVLGRMAIGLGGESVLETAITLHRTYGVPYIPGSALKGLAASTARKRTEQGDPWHPGGEAFLTVFGVLEDAGFVTFHDALWIPEGTRLPLHRDVMTVHHVEYYQGKDVPPADWDDPNPVAFLSACGSYQLALSGPRDWTEAAMDLLKIGLREDGIGAKTAAGYGRMEVEWEPSHIATQPASRSDDSTSSAPAVRPSSLLSRVSWELAVKAIDRSSASDKVSDFLRAYQGEELAAAAQALVSSLDRKWLKEAKRRDLEWVKALLAAAGQAP